MAKQVKIENVDRISDLHDSILSHILSFLSTKEAVQTSVLSTRWRSIFMFVPTLDFDLDEFSFCGERLKSSTINSSASSIDRMLFFYNKMRIDKFRLKYRKKIIGSRLVSRWISAALSRGVKHLDLDISCTKFKTMAARVLLACTTLVTLKLNCYFVLDVPKDFHFPNLKTLHLVSVEFFNGDSVKNLLSGCSSLDDMVIERCSMWNIRNFNISHNLLKRLTIRYLSYASNTNNWLTIDTPNLAYFSYHDLSVTGYYLQYSLENLQALIKADIRMVKPDGSQADTAALFRGICNVRSLTLSSRSLKLLCETLSVFATLVELEICGAYIKWPTSAVEGLESILSSSPPKLEKLVFDEVVLRYLPENPCFFSKLKVIRISGLTDNDYCIGKAKFILNNGGALQKLTISTTSYLDGKRKSKLYELLLASPRKSKQCSILVI